MHTKNSLTNSTKKHTKKEKGEKLIWSTPLGWHGGGCWARWRARTSGRYRRHCRGSRGWLIWPWGGERKPPRSRFRGGWGTWEPPRSRGVGMVPSATAPSLLPSPACTTVGSAERTPAWQPSMTSLHPSLHFTNANWMNPLRSSSSSSSLTHLLHIPSSSSLWCGASFFSPLFFRIQMDDANGIAMWTEPHLTSPHSQGFLFYFFIIFNCFWNCLGGKIIVHSLLFTPIN